MNYPLIAGLVFGTAICSVDWFIKDHGGKFFGFQSFKSSYRTSVAAVLGVSTALGFIVGLFSGAPEAWTILFGAWGGILITMAVYAILLRLAFLRDFIDAVWDRALENRILATVLLTGVGAVVGSIASLFWAWVLMPAPETAPLAMAPDAFYRLSAIIGALAGAFTGFVIYILVLESRFRRAMIAKTQSVAARQS